MSVDRSKEGIIKAWFDYNAETGEIRWKDWISPEWYKNKKWHETYMQEKAGKLVDFYEHPSGYLKISVMETHSIYAHQIVWVLTYGKMPEGVIDHIDGNPQNNTVENLRDVSQKINCRNQRVSKANTSGVSGVSWYAPREKWVVYGTGCDKKVTVGYYKSFSEAVKARDKFITDNPHFGYTERHGKDNSLINHLIYEEE